MNGPPPVGNENTVDIFVLSSNGSLAPVLREHLEQNGYHATLFDDDGHLLESLRSGKPNLLICDATNPANNACDFCRQIKSDQDLWRIPVLVITRDTELSDLLFVLDCNADNFITLPYDLPYLHSLIGGMLDTPVERPTPEQVKTQFKIQHNNQDFVITADRRKLLEFLLSSFEIAVTRRGEIARAKDQILSLDQAIRSREAELSENKRFIRAQEERLDQKDQDLGSLRAELREKDHLVAGKAKEIESLKHELEKAFSLLSDTQENLRTLTQENDAARASSYAEITSLSGQAAALSAELEKRTGECNEANAALVKVTDQFTHTQRALEETREENGRLEEELRDLTGQHEALAGSHEDLSGKHSSARQELEEIREQKEKADTALATLTAEHAAVEDALRKISDRYSHAQKELEEIRGEKGRTDAALAALGVEHSAVEESLQRISEESALTKKELEEIKAQKEAAETARSGLERQHEEVKRALAGESARVLAAEDELKTTCAAQAEREEELTRTIGELRSISGQQKADLERYRETVADAEAHSADLEVRLASLEKEKASAESSLGARIDDLQEQLADLQVRYSSSTAALEQKDAALKSMDISFAAADLELERARKEISHLKGELEDEGSALAEEKLRGSGLEDEIGALTAENERISGEIRLLATSLEEARSLLAKEKEEKQAADERIQEVIRDHADQLQKLRGAHDEAKTSLDLHRDDLFRTKRDLSQAEKTRSDLENSLTTAQAKIRELELELHAVSAGQVQAGQQARSLGAELEQVRAALETERRLRHLAEDNLKSALLAHERSSQDFGRIVGERGSLESAIGAEHKARLEAEQEKEDVKKALDLIRENLERTEKELATRREKQDEQIGILTLALESARAREKELEGLVESLRSEKQAAETAASSLSVEIEQARSALADEWEDHMNDQERLVVADKEKDGGEKTAIILKGPDLPAVVRPASPPMKIETVPKQAEPVIKGVEDLFEDELPDGKTRENVPGDAAVPDPVVELTGESQPGDEPGEPSATTDEQEPAEDTDQNTGAEESDEIDQDEDTGDVSRKIPSQPGIAFNRAQWFDLLRWSHHSGALSQEQRMQIVRMGRLIQRGRRLTQKQEEQVMEMFTLAQALGYRFMK